jgi:hypothetical protein
MEQKRGMVRDLKCNAMGNDGPGSLKISKGLAQVLGVPLYMHIGEFHQHKVEESLAMEASGAQAVRHRRKTLSPPPARPVASLA